MYMLAKQRVCVCVCVCVRVCVQRAVYIVARPPSQMVVTPYGGFPLNISPLPTVHNRSKVIHSQNQFTHALLTKVFYLKDLP